MDELIRSEEELRVGRRVVERGLLTLRKRVESAEVELAVDLEREVLRVEREPVGAPVESHDFREQSILIPLHAQEAVVRKKVVAKERVAVRKEVETHAERVRAELRREHAGVEAEPPGDT